MMEFLPIETSVLSLATLGMSYTLVIIFGIVRAMGAGVIVMLQMCVEEVMYDLYSYLLLGEQMLYSS